MLLRRINARTLPAYAVLTPDNIAFYSLIGREIYSSNSSIDSILIWASRRSVTTYQP